MAMLGMLYACLFDYQKTGRKMFFKVHILHIDESILHEPDSDGWNREQEKTKIVTEQCQKY